MQKNTVSIDTSVIPAKIEFAPEFNVAVSFIDRHLQEGRKDMVIIRETGGLEITYGQLAERVNQSGNVLKNLGLNSGDRMLMMVKDSAEFFYLFWGAIKAGIIPVPLNTLLRAKDYAFMIEDSGCAAVIYSPEFRIEVEAALELLSTIPEIILLTEGESECFLDQTQSADSKLETALANATDDCFWLTLPEPPEGQKVRFTVTVTWLSPVNITAKTHSVYVKTIFVFLPQNSFLLMVWETV